MDRQKLFFEIVKSPYWFDILFNHILIKSLGGTNILSFNEVFNSLSLCFVYLVLFICGKYTDYSIIDIFGTIDRAGICVVLMYFKYVMFNTDFQYDFWVDVMFSSLLSLPLLFYFICIGILCWPYVSCVTCNVLFYLECEYHYHLTCSLQSLHLILPNIESSSWMRWHYVLVALIYYTFWSLLHW